MILTVIVSLGPTLLMGAANNQANQRVTGASEEGSHSDANDDGALFETKVKTSARGKERKKVRRRKKELPKAINVEGVPATYKNVKYGLHERNILDIWLAQSGKTTPLVIYIHGGSFKWGDKSKIYKSDYGIK